MSYLQLPKRVFNSPLIRYTNFKEGSHINLIRLSKPYANGMSYAVHETTSNAFCSNGLFKSFELALEKYNLMVKNASYDLEIVSSGVTGNSEQF